MADRPYFNGAKAMTPDGRQFARKFKLGVYTNGRTSIADFLTAHPEIALSPSRVRVMSAVSANEGNLEAINTWDNAFLTFGAFQWIVGTGTGPGELAALLDRLKKADLAVFQEYFGQHGLDVADVTFPVGQPPTGYFSLNGQKLTTPVQKAALRQLEWAYRFWLAGHNDIVRRVEIEHAASRVDLFYKSPSHRVNGRFVSEYVTSEFGVALLLDQHVNRPGHVPKTLASAVTAFGPSDPSKWGTVEEMRLLNLYIDLRTKTSMTDALKRANNTRAAMKAGKCSGERGSYQP